MSMILSTQQLIIKMPAYQQPCQNQKAAASNSLGSLIVYIAGPYSADGSHLSAVAQSSIWLDTND